MDCERDDNERCGIEDCHRDGVQVRGCQLCDEHAHELLYKLAMEDLFIKSPYNWTNLQHGTDVDGWPMYNAAIDEYNLRSYLKREIGVVSYDSLYGLYYLYLNKNYSVFEDPCF